MAFTIRPVEYYSTTVQDQPGEAYRLLAHLAEMGINLLAFTAVPIGPSRAHLTLFPDDTERLLDAARKANMVLDGPTHALLIQGDDSLGALAEVHEKLARAGVDVYASSAVTDGRGSYAYVIYLRPDNYERALWALEV
jgi:hypothetical protein